MVCWSLSVFNVSCQVLLKLQATWVSFKPSVDYDLAIRFAPINPFSLCLLHDPMPYLKKIAILFNFYFFISPLSDLIMIIYCPLLWFLTFSSLYPLFSYVSTYTTMFAMLYGLIFSITNKIPIVFQFFFFLLTPKMLIFSFSLSFFFLTFRIGTIF